MKYIGLLAFFFATSMANAQKPPVKWSFELNKSGQGTVSFTAVAQIENGWNIYGVYMSDEGPIPTAFDFEKIENGVLDGHIIEKSEKISAYDELFEMDVIKFKKKAEFDQLFKGKEGLKVAGTVTYMACDSKKCLPPASVPFELKL
ncbi:MAG: hypothetical protein IPN29_19625 [Saprospiraceae bacterium]|nr:hypothetical protein [Saprospiraceae bacterium]